MYLTLPYLPYCTLEYPEFALRLDNRQLPCFRSNKFLQKLHTMAPSSRSRSTRRHAPLEQDLNATGPLRARSKKRKARPDDDGSSNYVDSRSSRKILKIGQDLADEEQQEKVAAVPNPAFTFESRFHGDSEPEEDGRYDDEGWGDEQDDIVEEVVGFGECIV